MRHLLTHRFRRITDLKGKPLAVGDAITGWYDDVPYTGTVTAIGTRPPGAAAHVRNITVRRDDGTDHQTFSHGVVIASGKYRRAIEKARRGREAARRGREAARIERQAGECEEEV